MLDTRYLIKIICRIRQESSIKYPMSTSRSHWSGVSTNDYWPM